MRYLMLLLVMVTALAQAQSRPGPYDENADAGHDIQAALKEAGGNGKFVLLEFGANW